MPSEVWKIRLLGGFRVASPSGEEIVIPSRKARALMALLALNDGLAITRESLGQQLWPDKPKVNQQQSLRQAIKDLKEAFEPVHVVDATRDVCRLALEHFSCDALECLNSRKDAGNVALLPEMPEPAFESYRSELASFAPLGDLGEAARGAASLLEWTIVKDPTRVLDMLHTCRELIPNMPLPLVEDALRLSLHEAPADHPLLPWGRSQFAIVLMWAGRSEEGMSAAKVALGKLQPEKDASDWTAAAHSAAIFLIFRGRFEKACKLLSGAIEIAETHKLKEAVDRFRHAEALCYGYSGDFDRALRLLSQLPPSPIVNVHEAIYLGLAELPEQAREKLASAKALAGGNSDARLASQMSIAEVYILIAEGKEEEPRALLNDLVQFCETYGIRTVQVHALEGLALLGARSGEASKWLEKAMELRERYRLPLLPGDRKRLSSVLSEGA
ncbi:MAG: hypothetical protein KF784_09315 [Fimbriimonadaceae bacterium]|nr:hypothetical protein [Fimbriimonadaceae bacterium]